MLLSGVGSKANQLAAALKSRGNLTFFKNYANAAQGAVASTVLDADYAAGSATATFTASRGASNPATWIDHNGIIQVTTTSNLGRRTAGFYNTTGFVSRPGLIVEGASTNQLRDSAFENSTITTNWSTLGGTLSRSTDYTNPYGGGSVAKLVCTAADDRFGFTGYSPTVTSGTVYTVSALVRSTTTDPLYFRYSDGVVQTSGNYTPSTTAWTLIQWQVTAGATGSLAGLNIANKNAVSRTFYVAYMQFEALPFASTFIPTTTASLTRNAETLKYPISGNRTAATESIFLKTTPFVSGIDITTTSHRALDTDTKSRLGRIAAGNDSFFFAPNGTDSATCDSGLTTPMVKGTSYVVGLTMASTGNPNLTLYMNGASEATDNDDFTANAWGTNFYIGSERSSTNQMFGIYQSIAIFSDAKSAADVLAISNLMAGA